MVGHLWRSGIELAPEHYPGGFHLWPLLFLICSRPLILIVFVLWESLWSRNRYYLGYHKPIVFSRVFYEALCQRPFGNQGRLCRHLFQHPGPLWDLPRILVAGYCMTSLLWIRAVQGKKSCFWSCDRLYGPLRVFPLFFLVQMLNLWVCNFQPLNVIHFYVLQSYDLLSICQVLFLLPRILYRWFWGEVSSK